MHVWDVWVSRQSTVWLVSLPFPCIPESWYFRDFQSFPKSKRICFKFKEWSCQLILFFCRQGFLTGILSGKKSIREISSARRFRLTIEEWVLTDRPPSKHQNLTYVAKSSGGNASQIFVIVCTTSTSFPVNLESNHELGTREAVRALRKDVRLPLKHQVTFSTPPSESPLPRTLPPSSITCKTHPKSPSKNLQQNTLENPFS